jgi:hypothetical protein
MALGKEDRISMSKKIVKIPDDNALIENVKKQILAQQQEAIENDAVNAALQAPYDEIINKYQLEYGYITGLKRTELTETIINNAAKGVNRNGFFLADPEFPIPSVPDGVWKFFAPMAFCYGIGKQPNEQYIGINGEEPAMAAIQQLITQAGSYSVSARATATECETNPNPPPAPPYISNPLPDVQTLLDNLKQEVQDWIDVLNAEKSSIVLVDENAARLAENTTAYNEIDPVIADLQSWQSDYDDFSSGSCPLSESWGSYPPVKLDPDSFNDLQTIISDRQAFLSTRKGQLNGYFGSVKQDLNTGEVTGFSGWYGDRYLILDSRLNLISGSANAKFGAEKAIATQNQIKASNDTTAAAYDLSMKAVKAAAPGLDTEYLNVLDASNFNVGDDVFVVADKQEELSGTIVEKDGNRVKLSFKVPKKYTLANLTRLYKLVNNPL